MLTDILACEDHPFLQIGLKASLLASIPDLKSLRLAGNGADALRLAREKRPDLVIVDLGLPDMSGLDLILRLKELWSGIRILVVTSCDNPSILRQARKIGVAGILQKSSRAGNRETEGRSFPGSRRPAPPARA